MGKPLDRGTKKAAKEYAGQLLGVLERAIYCQHNHAECICWLRGAEKLSDTIRGKDREGY